MYVLCFTPGLPGDLIASSFGKAAAHSPSDFNKNDVIRSLLFTIANDIGQIACLYALQHELKRVYFGGYFLRNHPLSMHAVSYAIKYWSRGSVEALFLRHEGYLGAIGAFLKGTEELDTDKYCWQENFAGSSYGQLPVRQDDFSDIDTILETEFENGNNLLKMIAENLTSAHDYISNLHGY